MGHINILTVCFQRGQGRMDTNPPRGETTLLEAPRGTRQMEPENQEKIETGVQG